MDKEYHSIKNQRKRIEERQKIRNAEIRFRKLMCSEDFYLSSYWHIKKTEIDFKYLKGHKPNYINNDNYTIYQISKTELFKFFKKLIGHQYR